MRMKFLLAEPLKRTNQAVMLFVCCRRQAERPVVEDVILLKVLLVQARLDLGPDISTRCQQF